MTDENGTGTDNTTAPQDIQTTRGGASNQTQITGRPDAQATGRGISATEGAQVPEAISEMQFMQMQRDPRYKTDPMFRAQLVEAYRAGRQGGIRSNDAGTQRDVKVVQEGSEKDLVQRQPSEVSEMPEEMKAAHADNELLVEQGFSDEEVQAHVEAVGEFDGVFGEGAFETLVDEVLDAGGADEAIVEALRQEGYDYQELAEAAVAAGGALILREAGALGFTSEGLAAFERAMEQSPAVWDRCKRDLLRGDASSIHFELATFKRGLTKGG